MINLSSNQIAILEKQYGVEPSIILAINFTDYFVLNNISGNATFINAQNTGTTRFYSDKIIYNNDGSILFPGKIISISAISASQSYSGEAGTSQVQVVIDDSDLEILGILGVYNIQKLPAYLYLHFIGMSIADMIPIFEGEIVSTFEWSDQNKEATFTILNRVEQKEVGFSPEQGWISDLPANLIGKPWPFGYGTVIQYPAVSINYAPICVSTRPWGHRDVTLGNEVDRLFALRTLYYGIALLDYIGALEAAFSGLTDLQHELENAGDQAMAIYLETETNRMSIEQVITEQAAFEGPMPVISNIPIPLVGMWEFGGHIIGASYKPIHDKELYGGSGVGLLAITGILPEIGNSLVPYYSPSHREQFTYIQAGTVATFIGESVGGGSANQIQRPEPVITVEDKKKPSKYQYPMVYVVNCLGGTIKQVYATRQAEGANYIMPVPKIYWEPVLIRTVPKGAVTTVPTFLALGIRFHNPLSSVPGVRWSDDIYVSYVSKVGPSLKDILRFWISLYTPYTYDQASMNALPNFQCNFARSDQVDVMTQIKDVCFQCNIAVWLSEGLFYFKYLPHFVPSPMSATLDDIIENSLTIGITPTENIVTKIRASWFQTYRLNERNYLALRYNDFRYGVHQAEYDYYVFQDPNSIMQSMIFWMYRKGNTWKRLKFRVPLRFLPLQLFDNLQLGVDIVNKYKLGTPGVSIDASVISITLDPVSYLIELELELPIYVGSLVNSPAYWMSQYTGQFYKIDENYHLTEKPEQTLFYQRGEQVGVQLATDKLALEVKGQTDTSPTGPVIHVAQPDALNGTPLPSNFDIFKRTDVGGPVRQPATGSSPTVPQQTVAFNQMLPKPAWDYNYPVYPQTQTPATQAASCIPGIINGKAGKNLYSCTVYPGGLSAQGQTVIATLLQDAPDDTPIPAGTWALFSLAGTTTVGDNVVQNYYFQIPLWM